MLGGQFGEEGGWCKLRSGRGGEIICVCMPKPTPMGLPALSTLFHSFHNAIVEFEASLIPSADPKVALAVNTKLRKYIQDMYARVNKVRVQAANTR